MRIFNSIHVRTYSGTPGLSLLSTDSLLFLSLLLLLDFLFLSVFLFLPSCGCSRYYIIFLPGQEG